MKEPISNRSFFETVYAIVRKVPKGRVTTFGAVAEASGIRMSARMVGWALSMCGKVKPPVPAHRVVNRQGMLTGKYHFDTPNLMQELLEQEGVKVENDMVVEFKKLYWKPCL
jgi:methylated-DNA-protein-cysteine methyltransferase-like protein